MKNYVPPFSITNKMLLLVSSIMEKIERTNSLKDLDKYPKLRKQNRIKSVHSSCSIEANSLSIDDVYDIINGIIVKGSSKDITEVKNAIKAYDEIEKINPLNEKDLLFVHSLFGENIISQSGKYRIGNEGVFDENGNAIFIAPPPNLVPSLMKDLFTWINDEYKNISPLILSCVFHYEFVFIHPFADGNGRMARYWQNALLSKWKQIFYWLPIENQIYKYQDDYYKAINKSHSDGNSNAFIEFMLSMINKTFEELLINIDQYNNSLSIYVTKLLKTLKKDTWYTSNQILKLLNLKSKETLRKNYIDPAIRNGFLEMEYPGKITSRNQRYKLIK